MWFLKQASSGVAARFARLKQGNFIGSNFIFYIILMVYLKKKILPISGKLRSFRVYSV
jgi:hypothetical protein